jgi:hypothetical protein
MAGVIEVTRIIALLCGALAALAAFGTAQAADPASAPGFIAPPTRIPYPIDPSQTPGGTPVATSAIPRELRRAVAADAAQRFNIPVSAVVLARAEQVTWRDGSLGCPEPGRSYSQALIAGFRVVAMTSAGEMHYHADSRGRFVNCAPAPVQH